MTEAYTSYDIRGLINYDHSSLKDLLTLDPNLLEETRKGALDAEALKKAGVPVTDQDEDGYFEVQRADLDEVLKTAKGKPLGLASYFADPPRKLNNPSNTFRNRPRDLELFEEWDKGIFNKIFKGIKKLLTDRDKDGYFEVSRSDLERALARKKAGKPTSEFGNWKLTPSQLREAFGIKKSSPLYFDFYSDSSPFELLEESIEKLLKGLDLPQELKLPTRDHNFKAARDYFTKTVINSANPLQDIAETLAKHLQASATHGGANVEDSVLLENPHGFSVVRDGRFRFDCGLFAQLAHSDLQDIPNLKFQYISFYANKERLSSQAVDHQTESGRGGQPFSIGTNFTHYGFPDPSQLTVPLILNSSGHHIILLVTDEKGNWLLVDNTSVKYFEKKAPFNKVLEEIKGYRRAASFFKRDQFNGTKTLF